MKQPENIEQYLMDQATIYEKNRNELVSHQKIIAQYTEVKKKIEIEVMGEIANEVDETDAPRFSNETKRKAEFEKRIKNHPQYNMYRDMIKASVEAIEDIKAAIDVVQMNVKVWDIIRR